MQQKQNFLKRKIILKLLSSLFYAFSFSIMFPYYVDFIFSSLKFISKGKQTMSA